MVSGVKIVSTCVHSTASGPSTSAPCRGLNRNAACMIEPHHYDLLAKYDSGDDIIFDPEELGLLSSILNLKMKSFDATRFPEYKASICEALHEQNRIMTELGGEFLNRAKRDSKLAVMNYLVANIGRITSPYMLSILFDLVCHDPSRARRASRRRRHR